MWQNGLRLGAEVDERAVGRKSRELAAKYQILSTEDGTTEV